MERIKSELVELITPTGFVVKIKKRLTYGEQQEITNEIMGDAEVGQGAESIKLKFTQASEMPIVTIFHYLTAWDATEDGKEVPITKENVKYIFYEEDINFLMAEIEKLKPKK